LLASLAIKKGFSIFGFAKNRKTSPLFASEVSNRSSTKTIPLNPGVTKKLKRGHARNPFQIKTSLE
jgi:hypothetical protein